MSEGSEYAWEEVKSALSTLITAKAHADGANWSTAFLSSQHYLERLGVYDELKRVRVLHIAGTKGKGSTAAFTSSILQRCGYEVGIFTSPHLCDVRERIRINGDLVSKDAFTRAFWECYNTLKPRTPDDPPTPGYFRFLTYLALRLFIDAKLDIIVLEVGIGGRLDSTNIIPAPVATAVTTLDYDHTEILGDTLTLIAGEKAGIFRATVPAFTCPQDPEAMESLQAAADKVGCPLELALPLSQYTSTKGSIELGLSGNFQAKNASIAVALCRTFDAHVCEHSPQLSSSSLRDCAEKRLAQLGSGALPAAYAEGLASCRLLGRAQLAVVDAADIPGDEGGTADAEGTNGRIPAVTGRPVEFFLDGAHTPESCQACANWFLHAGSASQKLGADSNIERILIFNCGEKRKPELLLEPLARCFADCPEGAFQHAMFVPADTVYTSVSPREGAARDVSWQICNATAWEGLVAKHKSAGASSNGLQETCGSGAAHTMKLATVHSSLQAALARVRARALDRHPPGRIQVLVTGSLHLVGDVLRQLNLDPASK